MCTSWTFRAIFSSRADQLIVLSGDDLAKYCVDHVSHIITSSTVGVGIVIMMC